MTRDTSDAADSSSTSDAADSSESSDAADSSPTSDAAERSDGTTESVESVPESADVPGSRFLLDAMLGKLATYLRMCGHDAAYALDRGVEADDRLRVLADREDRRLLTRDEALADRTPGAILLTERAVTDQLRELDAAGVDLRLAARPARCGRCNGPVELAAEPSDASPDSTDLPDTPDPSDTPDPPNGPTDSADTSDSPDRDRPEYVPGDVRAWRCLDCGQWFWKGSHWDRVAETLAAVRE